MRKETTPPVRMALQLLLFCGAAVHGFAPAQAGYIGIYGGGPLYMANATRNLGEMKNSGFTELILWSIEVHGTGDLNLNGEFLLASNGTYVGDRTHPKFASDLANVKEGTIQRITFSIGSSNWGDWQAIEELIDTNGTGKSSILYKNFLALKNGLPSLDALDFDDENCYDKSSTVKFAVMLGELGFRVTVCPYTYSDYWTAVVSEINSRRPGTVDAVHLQAYAGGDYNDPCSGWDFGSVPLYPGLYDRESSPESVKETFRGWHSRCNITGGFLWIEDDLQGTNEAAQYAAAFKAGLNITG